jgi:hypothetical protein
VYLSFVRLCYLQVGLDEGSAPTTPIKADYGQQQQHTIVQYQAYNSSSSGGGGGGNSIFIEQDQKLLLPKIKAQVQQQQAAELAAAAIEVGEAGAVPEVVAGIRADKQKKHGAVIAADREGAVTGESAGGSSSKGRSKGRKKHGARGLHLPLAIASGLVAGALAHLWRKREIYYQVGGGGGK